MRFSSLKFRYLLYTGSLLGCTLLKYHHTIRIPLEEGLFSEIPSYSARIWVSIVKLLCHLQQWLQTLVKERFLSTLGSWIGPIEWMLVIRQVARQPLPRVIPEKTFTDGLIICSYDTLVAGLILQSTPVDW